MLLKLKRPDIKEYALSPISEMLKILDITEVIIDSNKARTLLMYKGTTFQIFPNKSFSWYGYPDIVYNINQLMQLWQTCQLN